MPQGNYTPLATGAVPTLGTSGPSVAALQTQLNTQNAGKNGYVPLAVDSKYGPLTDAAAKLSNPVSQLSVTSKGAATTFANNASKINDYLGAITPNPTTDPQPKDDAAISASDPIIQGLKNLQNTNDAAQNRLIAEATASYQNQANQTNSQYENYKHGLQLIGIQHNEAQSTPDLLMAHIQSAANEQMAKISSLKAEEAKSIMTAQDAIANKDQTTLNSETTRLQQIKTEQRQALIDLHTAITQAPKLVSAQLDPATATAIYDELSKMDPSDHQAAVEALAVKLGVSPLTVVASLQADIKAGNKADLATANAQATLSKKTSGGSGTTSGVITKAQIAAGAKKLDAVKGTDGFIPPETYKAAADEWVQKGGTTKTFITNFPPKDYVNPKATGLSTYLMPTKTKTSTRTS